MLESLAIFLQDGTLFQTNAPTLIQGDNKSVKLFVTFWESSATRKALNLINYTVEAIVERPDGSVSPALTLSIDKDPTQRYLVINNWITEFAGTIKFTIRLKQGETIKATGFLNWQVGGGNVPTDTVITETQHDALQEAIKAEETVRNQETKENRENIQGLNQRTNYIEDTAIPNLSDRIDENVSAIALKLNKKWDDIPLVNELADDDYFILNSGSKVYKITVENLKLLLGVGTGETSGVNHYKGDYLTYEALVSANSYAQAGDYAFVNTETEDGDLLIMYIWDADSETWKETKSDQYVLSASFVDFQESIADTINSLRQLISTKQETLTFDETPQENSNNPVKSKGIYTELANVKQNITNINSAITNKQNKLTAGAGISISENGVISVSYPNGDEEEY